MRFLSSLSAPHCTFLSCKNLYLLQLVAVYGRHIWVFISSFTTRSSKQCREHFHQTLKPELNRTPITLEEGATIEQHVDKMGKSWTRIARQLRGGRSDSDVKNWWYEARASKNRRHKYMVRRETGGWGRPNNSVASARKTIMNPSHPGRVELLLVSSAEVSTANSVGSAPSLVSNMNIFASQNVVTLQPLSVLRALRFASSLPRLGFDSVEIASDGLLLFQKIPKLRKPSQPSGERLCQLAEVATSTSFATVHQFPQRSSSQPQCQLPPFKSLICEVQFLSLPPAKAVMSLFAILV